MRKKIIFGIIIVVILLAMVFMNEFIGKGIGGIFGFLAIGYAYKQLFKKKPKPKEEITLKKDSVQ